MVIKVRSGKLINISRNDDKRTRVASILLFNKDARGAVVFVCNTKHPNINSFVYCGRSNSLVSLTSLDLRVYVYLPSKVRFEVKQS